MAEWSMAVLRTTELGREPQKRSQQQDNPKDMPHVALQAVASADGVRTRDGGIAPLGGKPPDLDFVFANLFEKIFASRVS
jgi:hypothetical protein